MGNIVSDMQQRVVDLLQGVGIPAIEENSFDVEFEVKSALAKQGIACIVAVPELEHQGNNGNDLSWDATISVEFIENPSINRARLKKQGLESGTAMDLALDAANELCRPTSYSFPKFGQMTISESTQDQYVLVELKLKTLI